MGLNLNGTIGTGHAHCRGDYCKHSAIKKGEPCVFAGGYRVSGYICMKCVKLGIDVALEEMQKQHY